MTMAPSGTRNVRVGAILFTDLVGFTEFTDVVGDPAALEVLNTQSDLVAGVLVGRVAARVVKELGDGLMLWFDSPCDGLDGAVALLAAVDAAREEGSFPLAVRMGLNYGEVIARGDDLIGQAVNIASRVSDLAGPGELLVSESAITACGDACAPVELEPIGPTSLKGVHEAIWLHRLVR